MDINLICKFHQDSTIGKLVISEKLLTKTFFSNGRTDGRIDGQTWVVNGYRDALKLHWTRLKITKNKHTYPATGPLFFSKFFTKLRLPP